MDIEVDVAAVRLEVARDDDEARPLRPFLGVREKRLKKRSLLATWEPSSKPNNEDSAIELGPYRIFLGKGRTGRGLGDNDWCGRSGNRCDLACHGRHEDRPGTGGCRVRER